MVSGSAEKLGEKDKPSHQGKTGPGEERGNGKEGLNKVKIKERARRWEKEIKKEWQK